MPLQHHQRTSSSCAVGMQKHPCLDSFQSLGGGGIKVGRAESEPSSVCAQLDMCINKGIYYAGWHTQLTCQSFSGRLGIIWVGMLVLPLVISLPQMTLWSSSRHPSARSGDWTCQGTTQQKRIEVTTMYSQLSLSLSLSIASIGLSLLIGLKLKIET